MKPHYTFIASKNYKGGTTSSCGVKQIERDPNTRTTRTDPWSIGRVIPVKPWCTGKQLPLGFNPMDLGSVCESNAYGSVTLVCGPIGLGRYAQQDRVRVKPGETYRQPQERYYEEN